mmetsp:Transcript_11257/g.31231  ORF Transcript_11257/g.31231 Transcript_11257/m.31231 type:complete len:86 (-) Transcript_11257:554-811(-)
METGQRGHVTGKAVIPDSRLTKKQKYNEAPSLRERGPGVDMLAETISETQQPPGRPSWTNGQCRPSCGDYGQGVRSRVTRECCVG